MNLPPCRLGRFSSFSTLFCSGAAAARGPRRLPMRAAAAAVLAGGAALLIGALGPCAATALAAAPTTPSATPVTTGFIVAAPSPGAAASAGTALRAAPLGRTDGAAPLTLGGRRAQVLPAGIGPDGRAATTVDAGARFDMIGVLFRSTSAGVLAAQFHVRTSLDGLSWTPWFTVKADAQSGPAGSVEGAADLVTEPVWVGAARYVQYEAGGAPVSDVRLACIDAQVTASTAPTVAASPAASVAPTMAPAVATTTSGSTTTEPAAPDAAGAAVVGATTVGGPPEPPIVSRAKWGADESLRSNSPSYGVVRCAFVHHTVNANNYTRAQAPALVRGIYYYHTQVNGWNDIGYNFLIDRFGTIYEGRYGGVASAVIGAQVLGFNSMSTGVSLIGTFQTVAPSKAAVTSLERLLAWKLDLSHLDPQGTARVECSHDRDVQGGAVGHGAGHPGPSSGQLHRVPRQRAVRHAARHPHGRGRHRRSQDLHPDAPRRAPSAPTATACATASPSRPAVGRRRLEHRPERRGGQRGRPLRRHRHDGERGVARPRRRRRAPARRRLHGDLRGHQRERHGAAGERRGAHRHSRLRSSRGSAVDARRDQPERRSLRRRRADRADGGRGRARPP